MPETLCEIQAEAWRNKQAKGFDVTDVPMEFMLLIEEIGEAFSAWRKDTGHLGEELADAAIFLAGLAQMTGVDLQAVVEAKLAVNAAREYRSLPNGTRVKDEPAAELSYLSLQEGLRGARENDG
jgi:NTP pyrophosphatase (non-canonical NTP hydrolase)